MITFFIIPVFLLENVVYLLSLLSINSILILTLPFVFLPLGGGVFLLGDPFWPDRTPSSILCPIPMVDIVTSPIMGSCFRLRPATSADLLAECWWWPGELSPIPWLVGLNPEPPCPPMCWCWCCKTLTYESGPCPYKSAPESPVKALWV